MLSVLCIVRNRNTKKSQIDIENKSNIRSQMKRVLILIFNRKASRALFYTLRNHSLLLTI